jgi:hypothetical protein
MNTGHVQAIGRFVRDSVTRMRVDLDPHPLPDSMEGPGALPDRAAVLRGDAYAELRALLETAVRAASAQERER